MATRYPDKCVKVLVNWIFSTYEMDCIRRVWIQESDVKMFEHQLVTSSVKSILFGGYLGFDLVHDRFRPLEHLGGIGMNLQNLLSYQTSVTCVAIALVLRYVQYFKSFWNESPLKCFLHHAGRGWILSRTSKTGTFAFKWQQWSAFSAQRWLDVEQVKNFSLQLQLSQER